VPTGLALQRLADRSPICLDHERFIFDIFVTHNATLLKKKKEVGNIKVKKLQG